MKKFLATIIVLAVLAAAAYRGYNNYVQTPISTIDATGDVVISSGDAVTNPYMTGGTSAALETTNPNASADATGSTVVDEAFKAKLEQQQNIVLSGDKVTEDDIKLIEDILKQITDGTGTK